MPHCPPMSPRRVFKLLVLACVALQLGVVFQYGTSLFTAVDRYWTYPIAVNETAVPDVRTPELTTAVAKTTQDEEPKEVVVVGVARTPADLRLEKEAVQFMLSYNDKCEKSTPVRESSVNLCPCTPPILFGRLNLKLQRTPFSDIIDANPALLPGGIWQPTTCVARQRVAIVVPFKNRMEHLSIFLNHMHPILQRQQLHYQIFVVEQAFPDIFNKGALMNIGYKEASKHLNFDCIIFHDVDMILEDDRHIYSCAENIRHMGANVNKFKYHIGYAKIFGGVTAFSKSQFALVNGYSNTYFGWGGEDDNMHNRIKAQKQTIIRYPGAVSRYTMVVHKRDKDNPLNPQRNAGWSYTPRLYARDGLNTIQYIVHNTSYLPLYTWIYAEPVTEISNFTVHTGSCKTKVATTSLKLNLLDCAKRCLASVLCRAFSHITFTCHLIQKPCALSDLKPCNKLYCERMYLKRTQLSPEMMLLNQDFMPAEGNCVGGSLFTARGNASACSELCLARPDCYRFVHARDTDICTLKSNHCKHGAAENMTVYYHRTRLNLLDGYTNRTGDCKLGDIGGYEIPLLECALKCSVNDACASFTYVPNHEKQCWLKKQRCEKPSPVNGATNYEKISQTAAERA